MSDSGRSKGPPRWAVRASEPVARALAGRRWVPIWAIIHHHGRRSGTAYATPIALVPTVSNDVFLIGLPWGSKTNWARNVLAAGGATITWRGRDHRATAPRLVEPAAAAALSKSAFRAVVRRFPAAIVLTRSNEVAGPRREAQPTSRPAGDGQPRHPSSQAFSSSAITTFFWAIITWICSGRRVSSPMFAGMTCQLTPNRSLHQPHCSDSGTCESFDQ